MQKFGNFSQVHAPKNDSRLLFHTWSKSVQDKCPKGCVVLMTEKTKHVLVSFGGTTVERLPQFFVRVPSVLSRWRGFLSGARCRLAYSPADATATHCLLLQ